MQNNEHLQENDLHILVRELNDLLKRLEDEKQKKPELELEILKIKSELVRMHNQRDMWEIELEIKNKIHDSDQKLKSTITLSEIKSKGMIEAVGFAKITINALVIVNAGALLAILAFLGNILKSGCNISELNFLMKFIWAVTSAITASGLAYFSQIFFNQDCYKIGNCIRVIAILAASLALFLFVYGATETSKSFENRKIFNCPEEKTDILSEQKNN